jgi:hypothetical protein
MTEVASRFATSNERVAMLHGLLDLREELRTFGIANGNQWLDGSFVEDIEAQESRAPNDIDVVTFAARHIKDKTQWAGFVASNQDVFNSRASKLRFKCDHYFVDTLKAPELIIADTAYWVGLFGHKRQSLIWKGMIAVPLNSDDAAAKQLLP